MNVLIGCDGYGNTGGRRMRYQYTTCVYHGSDWRLLVELGWITQSVENGIATMIRKV